MLAGTATAIACHVGTDINNVELQLSLSTRSTRPILCLGARYESGLVKASDIVAASRHPEFEKDVESKLVLGKRFAFIPSELGIDYRIHISDFQVPYCSSPIPIVF